jgi:hypothetical protein
LMKLTSFEDNIIPLNRFICVGVIRQFIVLREEKNPGTKL